MVQTDIPQLARECSDWRDTLRSLRDEINNCKNKLQQIAGRPLSREQLTDVEHYHNQFHIQLINIHDLKQAVKAHSRRVHFESAANSGQIMEETLADHEKLYDQYTRLDTTLKELAQEFKDFSGRS